jgi:hypothetical protein
LPTWQGFVNNLAAWVHSILDESSERQFLPYSR